MYALIIVIGVLSSDNIGVTSQIVGKFKNLDECKAAATQPHATAPGEDISPLTILGSRWYCVYAGAK